VGKEDITKRYKMEKEGKASGGGNAEKVEKVEKAENADASLEAAQKLREEVEREKLTRNRGNMRRRWGNWRWH
jgi:hypothetical protein